MSERAPTGAPRGPLALFHRLYGRGPLHLFGHMVVIAITAYVLSIMFEQPFAPRPWNLALWLLGGAVFHDGVFLPAWGVINALLARMVGASDRRPIRELLTGQQPSPSQASADRSTVGTARDTGLAAGRILPTSRDQQRRVPVINHVRVPLVLSAVLFIVFAPRILNRQPQNFVNALGHAPPDFFIRWVWVTLGVILCSVLLYAVRWAHAGRSAQLADTPTGP